MDNRAIGVFDSGLGGLTCVKEIMSLLPGEDMVYFGDTGRVPYGTRSPETITKYAVSDVNFLKTFDIKAVVIACGTVSSISMEHLKSKFDLPIIGVVEPAAKAACSATSSGKIGIIGTSGTIASGKYARHIKELSPQSEVIQTACPLFVPLVENGFLNHPATKLIAEEYLADIKSSSADTLILGCTHYPLIKPLIGDIMGDGVNLIDPGAETAHFLRDYLISGNMQSDRKTGECRFYVSDRVESFESVGSMFLDREIKGRVHTVDIEKYLR
ncbi:MAG: glutamate racemase [Clostridia bacterium]|nr:glutamate racemase [Clostridia bacterium]